MTSNITEKTGWTKEQELLLQNWGEKSQGHSWLHKRSEKHFQKLSNYITIPTSVLAGLSGSVQFSLINDDSENFWIKLGTALTTFSVSLLSILQKSLNYQSQEERHRKMAIDFASLHRDISAELSIPPSERQNSKEYITACRTEMDKLTKASPNVPDSIIAEFNKKFKDKNLHKPDMAEGLQQIVLYDKSTRTTSHYKREIDRKLFMQRIFYKWKSTIIVEEAKAKYRTKQADTEPDASQTTSLLINPVTHDSQAPPEPQSHPEPQVPSEQQAPPAESEHVVINVEGNNVELAKKDSEENKVD